MGNNLIFYYMLNILRLGEKVSSTQKMVIESVQAFCKTELKPRVIQDYKHEVVDKTLFKKFGDMGIFGCLNESYKTYGLIAKEIEYIDSGSLGLWIPIKDIIVIDYRVICN